MSTVNDGMVASRDQTQSDGAREKWQIQKLVQWDDMKRVLHYMFGTIMQHLSKFEASMIVIKWLRTTIRHLKTKSPMKAVYSSVVNMFKLGTAYCVYYKLRQTLIEQWNHHSAPKVFVRFGGMYSIVQRLFQLQAKFCIDIPQVLHVAAQFDLSNDADSLLPYCSDGEQVDASVVDENASSPKDECANGFRTKENQILRPDYHIIQKRTASPTSSYNIEKILTPAGSFRKTDVNSVRTHALKNTPVSTPELMNAPPSKLQQSFTKSRMNCAQTSESATEIVPKNILELNNMNADITALQKNLFSEIRSFKLKQGLTPLKARKASAHVVALEKKDQTKTMFANLSASMQQRRARLSTAEFMLSDEATSRRGVYQDGHEDDSFSSYDFDEMDDCLLKEHDPHVGKKLVTTFVVGARENASPNIIVDKRLSDMSKSSSRLTAKKNRRANRLSVYVPSSAVNSPSD